MGQLRQAKRSVGLAVYIP